MNKPTKGPWNARPFKMTRGRVTELIIDSADWREMALVWCQEDDDDVIGSGEANARLMAAAPELLAALEELLPDLRCWCDVAFTSRGKHQPNTLCRHEDGVKAAIAKARGQG
jgi:hypothetical protein